jgi:AcrR family transcriptional regulator
MTASEGQQVRPDEQRVLIDAALSVIRSRGIAGLTVADVLATANLGTRAFYRHYKSKSHLIISVFVDAGHQEALRLRARMAPHGDPVDAVVAWIDGRLDLAFDDAVQSDLRFVSGEAQALYTVEPELIASAYAAMLSPLADELRRGVARRRWSDVDPLADARLIEAVVWSCVEQQWATKRFVRADVRDRTVSFCLRAIGTSPTRIKRALKT